MKTLANAGDAAEVKRRLGSLRADSVPAWGRMTAHQMVCHLSDGYRILTGERATHLVKPPLPRPVMKWFALYAPVRWPRGLPTTPDLDQRGGGSRPIDFAADVAVLAQLLDSFTGDRRRISAKAFHPLFGAMSEAAWLRWAYLHADHHFRQFGI